MMTLLFSTNSVSKSSWMRVAPSSVVLAVVVRRVGELPAGEVVCLMWLRWTRILGLPEEVAVVLRHRRGGESFRLSEAGQWGGGTQGVLSQSGYGVFVLERRSL